MIRDPSDGSVKEITPDANDINSLKAEKLQEGINPMASGLPMASTKSKDVLRLEASREWLKTYRRDNLVLLFFAIAMVPVWAWILVDSIGNLLR